MFLVKDRQANYRELQKNYKTKALKSTQTEILVAYVYAVSVNHCTPLL